MISESMIYATNKPEDFVAKVQQKTEQSFLDIKYTCMLTDWHFFLDCPRGDH